MASKSKKEKHEGPLIREDIKKQERVQTAEGWHRSILKQRQEIKPRKKK